MFVAIALIVLWAADAAARRAQAGASALRTFDRASLAIAITAGASIVIAQVWFALIPITAWDGTGAFPFPFPFPFGSVDMEVTPLVEQ